MKGKNLRIFFFIVEVKIRLHRCSSRLSLRNMEFSLTSKNRHNVPDENIIWEGNEKSEFAFSQKVY